jgi:SulP family sulfate permease
MKAGAVSRWLPGIAAIRSYDRGRLRPDLLAALSVWALLIPQGLAYAQLAGMPAVTGLYAGMVAMLAYGLFGTSRYLNVGPESSVAILVAASLPVLARGDPEKYQALAATMALLTGAILLIGFLLRLGVITRLLSSPVLTGYLAGSAIIMALNQLPKVFGFSVDKEEYPYIIGGIWDGIGMTNPWAIAISMGTVIVMVVAQRISRRLPAGFIALALATVFVAVAGLADQVDVIGHIQRGLPTPSIPDLSPRALSLLLVPSASAALLIFSGSVLTAEALASRDREDLNANREFIGLGAGNVVASFFSGFPVAGSDSRSFVVVEGGGRSQMVSFSTAVLVAVTLLLLTPLFSDVPDAALGAVVLVTASKLFDLKAMRRLWRVRRTDFALMAATFAGVLITGVLGGIIVGVIASLVETVRRTIQPRTAVLGMVAGAPTWRDVRHEGQETVPGVVVYRFDAPLFFGNATVLREQILEQVSSADPPVHDVVISAEAITDLDTTAVEILERLLGELSDEGVTLSFARVRTPVREMMKTTGFEEKAGSENFYLTIEQAVRAVRGRAE